MSRCNFCGDTQFSVVEDHGAVQVVQCACQLVFVTPVPSRDRIEETYQADYYEAWKAQGAARQKIWTKRLQALRQIARRPVVCWMLDVERRRFSDWPNKRDGR